MMVTIQETEMHIPTHPKFDGSEQYLELYSDKIPNIISGFPPDLSMFESC